MRTNVIRTMAVCCLLMLGFGAPAHADNALCDRFLVFVAQVSGDATGEFKRRISFLLDAGKIGENHLVRMSISDEPVSPFEAGKHLVAELVPHETAIKRLVRDENLDWEKVRQFIEELLRDIEKGRAQRVTAEEETAPVFCSIGNYDMGGWAKSQPAVLELKGKAYVAATSKDKHTKVFNLLSGGSVFTAKPTQDLNEAARPVMFGQDGKAYVAVATENGHRQDVVQVFDMSRTGEVARIDMHGILAERSPRVFEENGRAYLLLTKEFGLGKAADTDIYSGFLVYEAITGKEVAKIDTGREPNPPEIVRRDGKVYVVGASEQMLYVHEALGGGELIRKELFDHHERVKLQSPVFENAGKSYVALVSERGLDGEAPKQFVTVVDLFAGTILSKMEIPAMPDSPPILFEQDGKPLLFTVGNNGVAYLSEALTGQLVRTVSLSGEMRSAARSPSGEALAPLMPSPSVLKKDGVTHLVIPALYGDGSGSIYRMEVGGSDVVEKVFGMNGVHVSPTLFEDEGLLKYVAASDSGEFYLGDALVKTSVMVTNVKPGIGSPPVVLRVDGRKYAVAAFDNNFNGVIGVVLLNEPLPGGKIGK